MHNRINSNHIAVTTDENGSQTKGIKIALIVVTSIIALSLSAIIFIWLCITGGLSLIHIYTSKISFFLSSCGFETLIIILLLL